jgi:hypothetical protein
MEMTNTLWAATCAGTFGGFATSDALAAFDGTAMPTAALAGIVRKPANVDVRYDAQGARPAWSPPV